MYIDPEAFSTEPGFDDVINEFDASDTRLLMNYGRYLDQPSPERMEDITTATVELFEMFSDVLRKLKGDTTGVTDVESRPRILATMIHGLASEHSKLLADYTHAITLPSSIESQRALEMMSSHFADHDDTNNDDDMSGLVDVALGSFNDVLSKDMEIIEFHVIQNANSSVSKIKEGLRNGSKEVAKIGAGVIAGLFIYDRLNKR